MIAAHTATATNTSNDEHAAVRGVLTRLIHLVVSIALAYGIFAIMATFLHWAIALFIALDFAGICYIAPLCSETYRKGIEKAADVATPAVAASIRGFRALAAKLRK